MSQDLDDIINALLSQIWDSKEGNERYLCEIYLQSTCQKHLFAEKRLESLVKHIEDYTQRYKENEVLDRLSIEMDFDHCVLSLRSSLEHLAQLINAIIPLNLSPKVTKGQISVSLKSIIEEMRKNELLKSNENVLNLSSYLQSEIEKDWYRALHDLRIEMFHEKFGRLTRTTLKTLEYQLKDLKFLLPNGTANSFVTEKERDITYFCESMIKEVERVIKESFSVLSMYLTK